MQIEQLLREKMGLDAASIGSSLIQRTVRLRMKGLGLKEPYDYKQFLLGSPAEWKELIESVVVTETWFFRDREPFSALVRLVLEHWAPAHPTGTVRLLSIPCSSGEEPYSMAMALLDAGLSGPRFQIDAVDISGRILVRAKRGVYGKNSFRGKDLAFRDRYFKPAKDGFVLDPKIRNAVRFRQDNILSATCLAGEAKYDFIFCRNLLIYFDRPTQQKALGKLAILLTSDGVLFVGAAEQPLVIEQWFEPVSIPMAFACRKAGQFGTAWASRSHRPSRLWPHSLATGAQLEAHSALLPQANNGSKRSFGVKAPARNKSATLAAAGRVVKPARAGVSAGAEELLSAVAGTPILAPSGIPGPQPRLALETARRLADAGRLEEAFALCETYLRESGASAQAYYLLGLVRDATGDPSAIDYYRKALYLEPNHYETLLQMALLSQKNGDSARARMFKSRAQRIKTKS